MAHPVGSRCTGFWRDRTGSIAVETGLISGLLVVLVAQALDFGWYVYCALQVRMAAQAAVAQAAVTCNTAAKLPATVNCSGVSTSMTTAAQQVSLGNAITMNAPTEGYYCVNGSALVSVGSLGAKPANCSPYSTATPGDYVSVTTTHTFAPLFPGLTVVAAYAGPISASAMMRVG